MFTFRTMTRWIRMAEANARDRGHDADQKARTDRSFTDGTTPKSNAPNDGDRRWIL